MKSSIKILLRVLLCVLSILIALLGHGNQNEVTPPEASSVSAETTEQNTEPVIVSIRSISKHGNVVLNTTFDEMSARGMEVGDLISIFAADREYVLPIGTAFTDVDSGQMICRFDIEDNEVALAINMGSFAKETGIGEKKTIVAEPGYQWELHVTELRLLLKEKQGYLAEYRARNLTRTDAREDYPELNDAEFANFRAISVNGLKENVLYRSSTPVEPAIGRNEYAMAAMEQAGIRAVVNLDDSVETMQSYATYPDSYYSRCRIVNPEMNYDFGTEEFAEKVKESILFLIGNDGPYLIHCKEGKDRTGILCAILECFVGASAKDVTDDYMMTYQNYYHIQPGDATYSIILQNNLVKTLCNLFQVDSIETVNLKETATRYLRSIGLTEEHLAALSARFKN